MHKERWWWPFPIASMLGSSAAIVFGREVYGAGERPIIRAIHRKFYWLQNVIYEIRYRTQRKHMYHLIDTKLKPGYYDYDKRMLHGCMSLLCDYVESRHKTPEQLEEFIAEMRKNPENWGVDSLEAQASGEEEALNIYRWWKNERAKAHELESQMLHEIYSNKRLKFTEVQLEGVSEPLYEMNIEDVEPQVTSRYTSEMLWEYQRELQNKDQEMLIRLVKIREMLWD